MLDAEICGDNFHAHNRVRPTDRLPLSHEIQNRLKSSQSRTSWVSASAWLSVNMMSWFKCNNVKKNCCFVGCHVPSNTAKITVTVIVTRGVVSRSDLGLGVREAAEHDLVAIAPPLRGGVRDQQHAQRLARPRAERHVRLLHVDQVPVKAVVVRRVHPKCVIYGGKEEVMTVPPVRLWGL